MGKIKLILPSKNSEIPPKSHPNRTQIMGKILAIIRSGQKLWGPIEPVLEPNPLPKCIKFMIKNNIKMNFYQRKI